MIMSAETFLRSMVAVDIVPMNMEMRFIMGMCNNWLIGPSSKMIPVLWLDTGTTMT